LHGHARQGDLSRIPRSGAGGAIVAAYLLNELPEVARASLEDQLFAAAGAGVRLLVLEPIARSISPWWDRSAERFRSIGGRADEWRVPLDLPPLLRTLDHAAGLNHRELKVRTIYAG
jgi:hypothetical protein